MFKQILVATDGSEHGARAVEVACGLAAACGSTVSIVHVLGEGEVPESLRELVEAEHLVEPVRLEVRDLSPAGGGVDLGKVGETAARRYQVWRAVGEFVIEAASAEAGERGVPVGSAKVVEGDPATAIIRAAKDCGADLVVLGRRGVSDLRGLLMGSVSHKVSQLAEVAVLTVK